MDSWFETDCNRFSVKNWSRIIQSHVLTHFGYLYIEITKRRDFRIFKIKKSRKDAISEFLKFKFFKTFNFFKIKLFREFKYYKNQNYNFSFLWALTNIYTLYIYPNIEQKGIFFYWWLVGFELVIFHCLPGALTTLLFWLIFLS